MRLFSPLAIIRNLGHTPNVNFLAHLYLSDPTPASMIGNLLPDLVPGPLDTGLYPGVHPGVHPGVLAGVRNHKRVDAFTDIHPVFARSRARLRPRHGRYSAILTDMFYDHFLAQTWDRYHDQPLEEFIDRAHAALAGHTHLMPDPMPAITGRMIKQDWLRSYATIEGMRRVLRMMSIRFSERLGRPVELEHAVDDLRPHGDGLASDFEEFFPQLIAYVTGPTASAHRRWHTRPSVIQKI